MADEGGTVILLWGGDHWEVAYAPVDDLTQWEKEREHWRGFVVGNRRSRREKESGGYNEDTLCRCTDFSKNK